MKINTPYNVVMPSMSYSKINSYQGKPSAYISDLKQSVMESSHSIALVNHHTENVAQGKEFVNKAVEIAGPLDGKIIDTWA